MLKLLADPSLAPTAVNEVFSYAHPLPRFLPPPAADSGATLLPPSLNQVLLTAPDTGALYQAVPRSTKRHVGEGIAVPGHERHSLRRR
jgi:hypothetical protein